MAPWLDLEWKGKSVTFYFAFRVPRAKDSCDVFKGATDHPGVRGWLVAWGEVLRRRAGTLGLVRTQHLMVRGLKREGGPQSPPPPVPAASSPWLLAEHQARAPT